MKRVACLVLNEFVNDSRVLKEARTLQISGYHVTIYAIHNEGLEKDEVLVFGSRVKRIFLRTKNWAKSKPIQIIKWFEWFLKVAISARKSSIIHCNDLNTLPVGVFIKLLSLNKCKLIYDSHEFAINDTPYESKWSVRFKFFLEKSLICFADRVIVVSDSIAREYGKLYGVNKPAVVLNCPNYQKVNKNDLLREELDIEPKQKIYLYQGGLGYGRGIEILLEAFASMENSNAVIVFMGYGILEESIRKYSKDYKNIYYKSSVSPEVILKYTSSADVGISFIEDSCLSYRYCLPNKLFEYIMAGLPVIVSNLPEMSRLVSEYDIGVVAKANTMEGFKQAVQEMENSDTLNIKSILKCISEEYSWERQEVSLREVYSGI